MTSNTAPEKPRRLKRPKPHDPATCPVCDVHGEVVVGWRPASMQVPPEAIYAPCPLARGGRTIHTEEAA